MQTNLAAHLAFSRQNIQSALYSLAKRQNKCTCLESYVFGGGWICVDLKKSILSSVDPAQYVKTYSLDGGSFDGERTFL